MSQVVEHSHEEDEVEFPPEFLQIVDVQLAEFDLDAVYFGGESSLREVTRVGVDADDVRGSPAFHLLRIEPSVTADVEHGLAGEIGRYGMRKRLPLALRVVAEEVMRSGLDAAQVHVLEPVSEFL